LRTLDLLKGDATLGAELCSLNYWGATAPTLELPLLGLRLTLLRGLLDLRLRNWRCLLIRVLWIGLILWITLRVRILSRDRTCRWGGHD